MITKNTGGRCTATLLILFCSFAAGCVTRKYVQAQVDQIQRNYALKLERTRADLWKNTAARVQTELFADAYKQASTFTLPVVASARFFDRSVASKLATFVVLNSDGWIVTAGHVFEYATLFKQDGPEVAQHSQQVSLINANPLLNAHQKRVAIDAIRINPHWVTNFSLWWGADGTTAVNVLILPEADLAIARLTPFDPKSIEVYPTIKNPTELANGTSLCKLGFPFYSIPVAFDEGSGAFRFPMALLPIPRFPIEGIYTRTINAGESRDGRYAIQFLETSSPGLPGQSGGPIFDTAGRVWGIQVRTQSVPLEFSVPDQYLNLGIGVHPALIVQFLKNQGVRFQLSE
jgi:hypothetical protein